MGDIQEMIGCICEPFILKCAVYIYIFSGKKGTPWRSIKLVLLTNNWLVKTVTVMSDWNRQVGVTYNR